MGTYLIRKTETGYVFHLKAANGENVGTSHVYMTKDDCKAGIENVRNSAGSEIEDQTIEGYEELDNPKFEIYIDKAGQFRFRLRAPDGENILVSQGYTAKASCKNGIASVKNNAPDSEIVDDSELSSEETEDKDCAEQYDESGFTPCADIESEAEDEAEDAEEELLPSESEELPVAKTERPKKKFNWKFWQNWKKN